MNRCTKQKFTETEAKLALARAHYASKIKNNHNRQERRHYYCKYCDAYHLTSRPRREAVERIPVHAPQYGIKHDGVLY